MTQAEKVAYQRGYQRGHKRRWPQHFLIEPDNELVRAIFVAAKDLRDCVDSELGALDGDDPWTDKFGAKIDVLDKAFLVFNEWLAQDHLEIHT